MSRLQAILTGWLVGFCSSGFAYSNPAHLITADDSLNHVVHYEYDAAGRQIKITDALGHVTTHAYDLTGRRLGSTDALGRTVKYDYDLAGKLIATIYPDPVGDDGDDANNPRMAYEYDAAGRKVAQTDEAGRITRFAYDSLGRLVQVVLPNPATGANPPLVDGASPDAGTLATRYAYDEQGNKLSQTDAEGRVTRWTYDKQGRVTRRTLPLGQQETFAYDAAGQQTGRLTFNGETITTTYDVLGRVATLTLPNGHVRAFTYGANGQPEQIDDAGAIYRFDYDVRDRLSRVTDPFGRAIAYAYDASGNRTELKTARQQVNFAFDELGRLRDVVATLDDGEAQATHYAYNATGSRIGQTNPNGSTVEYQYDRRNRLSSLLHKTATGLLLLGMNYTVDASGLRTQIAETRPGTTTAITRTAAYTYDAVKRLTREQITGTNNQARTTSWTYDKVGNRKTESSSGTVPRSQTYTYDANDRLTKETGTQAFDYVYDNAGNLLQKKQGSTIVASYTWNAESRLTAATIGTGASQITTTYAYDASGIRSSQEATASGTTKRTEYLVDSNQAYAQVLEDWEAQAATGSTLQDEQLGNVYVHGDDLISQTLLANDIAAGTHVYHYDGLGSTRFLTSSDQTVTDRYTYTAFGDPDPAGSSGNNTNTTENAYRYTGEQLDPNLGWYYLRARYMEARSGRFVGMDSYAGNGNDPASLHKYAYAHADPVNGRDPSGYMTLGEVGTTLNVASNLYTAGAITFNVLTGNYGAAGVMAKEIAEEVVLSKLSYLRPVAKLSDEATALFGRIWSRTVKLKLGYARDSTVLRHNMEEILGKAPGNHQAHHIVGGAYAEGKQATQILQNQGIDVNSLMNGVFLPACGNSGGLGAIHCGKHTQAYEKLVLELLRPLAQDKTALVNKLNEIREALLAGSLRLNKH